MCLTLVLVLALYEGRADFGLVLASGTALLELILVIATALFFSSIVVTPTLAGLFTAAVFVSGRSAGYLHFFLQNEFSSGVKSLAQVLYWILPHLHRFNIADKVVHGSHIEAEELVMLALYAFAYTGVLLVLSVAFFSRREFT
jgi:ABC-type transport system involved in multi-copper enzyme maturation permease subunit